jgi:putative transposase
MKRTPSDPDLTQRWLTFLRNHREAIAAMDFFTVPTVRFGVLYCFFVISHSRRRILHFNVTRHPTTLWIVQQLREAFPFESPPRFLIFDRDAKYGLEVPIAARSLKIDPVRTAFESPWQNGVEERWVESCRRDLSDHIIAMSEGHLKRLLSQYVRYYHEDRSTDKILARDNPATIRIDSPPGRNILGPDRKALWETIDGFPQADLSGRIRSCGQNELNARLFGEERVDVGFGDH